MLTTWSLRHNQEQKTRKKKNNGDEKMTTTETRRMNASVAGIAVAWMMANTPSVATILAPVMSVENGWTRTVSSDGYANRTHHTTDATVAAEWVRMAERVDAEKKAYHTEREQHFEDIRNGIKEQILNPAGYPYSYPSAYQKYGWTQVSTTVIVDLTAHADHWAEYDSMMEQSLDGAPSLYFP